MVEKTKPEKNKEETNDLSMKEIVSVLSFVMSAYGAAEIALTLGLRNTFYRQDYQEYLNGSIKYNDESMKNLFIPLSGVLKVGAGMLGIAYSYMMEDSPEGN